MFLKIQIMRQIKEGKVTQDTTCIHIPKKLELRKEAKHVNSSD